MPLARVSQAEMRLDGSPGTLGGSEADVEQETRGGPIVCAACGRRMADRSRRSLAELVVASLCRTCSR